MFARNPRAGNRPVAQPREASSIIIDVTAEPAHAVGDRVFHQKFGNGNVTAIDGNKLTIAFDRAGEKRVVDNFVQRA